VRGFGFLGRVQTVPPGLYRIVLSVDGKDYAQTLRVEPDPSLPLAEQLAADEGQEQDSDEMIEEEEGEEAQGDPIIH
jgi:hypothetical protein